MRNLAFIIFLSLSGIAFTQVLPHKSFVMDRPENKNHEITIDSRYNSGSPQLTNSFMNELFGGYVDEESKQDAYSQLNAENHAGYYFNYGVFYKGKPWKYNLDLILGVRSLESFHARFSKTSLQVLLSGNSWIQDQQVALDPFHYYYATQEDVLLGLGGLQLGSKIKVNTWFNIVKTSNYQNISIHDGYMYVSQSGDSVDVYLNMESSISPMGIQRVHAYSGWGLGLNLEVEYQQDNLHLQAGIYNAGLNQVNKVDYYAINSGMQFTGIDIEEIQDSTAAFSALNTDSIQLLFNTQALRRKERVGLIPQFSFLASYTLVNWQFDAGVNYLGNAYYLPQFHSSALYTWNTIKIALGPILSYGGYDKWAVGFIVDYRYKDVFTLKMCNFYLENVFLPSKTHGQGLQFSAHLYL